jgi:hypothetical protein
MNRTKMILLAILLVPGAALPLNAGLFGDTALEVDARVVPHTFSKDEIVFTLRHTASQKDLLLENVELKLVLNYKDKTRTIYTTKRMWITPKPNQEVIAGMYYADLKLPDNLTGLKTFRLTGTIGKLERMNEDPKKTKELHGYNIDSSFDATSTYSVQ